MRYDYMGNTRQKNIHMGNRPRKNMGNTLWEELLKNIRVGASPILTLATSGKRTRNQISLLSFLGKLSGNSLENLIQANSKRGGEGGMALRYMGEPSQIQNSKNFKLPFTVFN